jgi:hypothetical protein
MPKRAKRKKACGRAIKHDDPEFAATTYYCIADEEHEGPCIINGARPVEP